MTMSKYAGAEWYRRSFREKAGNISAFGERVLDLLGQLSLGLYHLNMTSLSKADFSHPHHIEVVVHQSAFATYDYDHLTRLVVLCHDFCVRCEIRAASANWGLIRLCFSPRTREGGMMERHPTMEDAIENIRTKLCYDPCPYPEAVAAFAPYVRKWYEREAEQAKEGEQKHEG